MSAPQQPTTLSSTLLATASAYLKVFDSLDAETIFHLLSSNYKHEFVPASLPYLPPPMTRDAFSAHLARLRQVLRSFPVRVKQVWPNPSLCQVVVWADSVTEFHAHVKEALAGEVAGEEGWVVRGEYIFVLTTDERGEKIEEVLEFLDSSVTKLLQDLVGRALERLGK